MRILLFTVLLIVANDRCLAQPTSRQMSAYGGFDLDGELDSLDASALSPMQKAGFNTVEINVRPTDMSFGSRPERLAKLKSLIERVKSHDLGLYLYSYPHPQTGQRDETLSHNGPAFVNSDGVEKPNLYSLANWAS